MQKQLLKNLPQYLRLRAKLKEIQNVYFPTGFIGESRDDRSHKIFTINPDNYLIKVKTTRVNYRDRTLKDSDDYVNFVELNLGEQKTIIDSIENKIRYNYNESIEQLNKFNS